MHASGCQSSVVGSLSASLKRSPSAISRSFPLRSGQLVQLYPKNNERSEATVNAENSKGE